MSTPISPTTPCLSAEAAFMPQCRTLLAQGSYPGAGTNVSCDPRRRNAWLGDRGATAERMPGLALAAVARGVLEEASGLLPLLEPSDVQLARAIAALDEPSAPPGVLDLVAHCFAAPATWTRLAKLRARSPTPPPQLVSSDDRSDGRSDDASDGRGGIDVSLDVDDDSAGALHNAPRAATPDPEAAVLAGLQLAADGALLEVLPASRATLPAGTLTELVPSVASLPLRALRALFGELGVTMPPPAARLPPPSATRPSAAQPLDGPHQTPAHSADALAKVLCDVLSRRRGAACSLAPLHRALGPCARMPPAVSAGVRRLCIAFFAAAHYTPEEAATMLRGHGGLAPRARFGAAAPIAALPAARHLHLASPAALARYMDALALAERAEKADKASGGGEAASANSPGRDARALLAVHDEAAASLLGGGEGHAAATCAILGRVLLAGCAQLRRQNEHAASARCLLDAIRHAEMPRAWRAAAFVQWVKDLDHSGSINAAMRLCELAHRDDGLVCGATLGAVAEGGGEPLPAPPHGVMCADSTDGHGAERGGADARDTFRLSAAQLIGIRRLLKKRAEGKLPGGAPRRWKKPRFEPLATAREVRLVGREASDEGPGGAGRRLGWHAADGSIVGGVEQFVRLQYLHAPHCAPRGGSGGGSSSGGVGGRGTVWTHGVHLENSLFLSMFALLMWEALFQPLPCAFGASWQDAPDDLLSGGRGVFHARRRPVVDALLDEIESAPADEGAGVGAASATSLAARLASAYAAHHGEACIGIDWARLDLPLLQWAASALGARVVSAICRALSDDYVGMSHGAPDLLFLSSSPVLAARLVEVKGPNDKLSDGQHAWIDVLVRAGADVEVAYVERC